MRMMLSMVFNPGQSGIMFGDIQAENLMLPEHAQSVTDP